MDRTDRSWVASARRPAVASLECGSLLPHSKGPQSRPRSYFRHHLDRFLLVDFRLASAFKLPRCMLCSRCEEVDRMIEAVIFDIDGTLVDSVDLHARAWQEALQHFG
jgi:Haloacid dehalogenase-like hydrolase